MADFAAYLAALSRPFLKLCRLEVLNADNSVAFSLDNNFVAGYNTAHDTRAFVQDGSLEVSLNNGARRKATVTLGNYDGAFDYDPNKIWFGKKIRLLMGLRLPDGTDFYLPQGVFYIANPQGIVKPSERTITYNLVDKWAYLDGSLFGNLDTTFSVPVSKNGQTQNIFDVVAQILKISKYYFPNVTGDISEQIDNITPVFTNYYNSRDYALPDGTTANMLDVPYDINVNGDGGTLAQVILELNNCINGLIGYDAAGALRIDPSQDDINDAAKPLLWAFSPSNSTFCGLTENIKNEDVRNDVIVAGETLTGYEIWGRAQNYDPASPANINLIGDRIYRETQSNYFNAAQCTDLAAFRLKQKTILQKSITITSSQMFHLHENNIVSIQRTDKAGNPVEKHLIQSYSLPLGTTGEMTINAVSVSDFPKLKITKSDNASA